MFNTFSEISVSSRWREQKHPTPIVVALITSPDGADAMSTPTYLLIRRKKAPYMDRWALVGGKWDFGEQLADAVVREVQEETGLLSTFIGLQGILSERLAPANAESGQFAHFLILVCQVKVGFGIATEQSEGAIGWFTLADIGRLHQSGEIIPSDYEMINHFSQLAPISFYEVEMISGSTGDSDDNNPNLIRFEEIQNHAPPAS